MMKKYLLASFPAIAFSALAIPALAEIIVEVAPPPPRVEVAPPPRNGYFWVPGHWDWMNDHHVWIAGEWQVERKGYYYREHHWVQRDGRWYLEPGRWILRDRDDDRVPDNQDRYPNDPYRH
jgi:hypothetical protein